MVIRRLKIKYLAALAMLLVALLSAGGATWAWFARNNDASADGMQIRVKAEGTYMLIANGALDADGVQAVPKSTATVSDVATLLYPAAHDIVATMSDADDPANWYYKNSFDPDSYGGSGNETGATALNSTVFGEYVLASTFSITVADNANPIRNIKVEDCTIQTAGDRAVRVLVASSTAAEEFSDPYTEGHTILSAAGVTDQTVLIVKVYIYWDGTDTDVYSNNRADLLNTSVEVSFSGDIVEPT